MINCIIIFLNKTKPEETYCKKKIYFLNSQYALKSTNANIKVATRLDDREVPSQPPVAIQVTAF